MITVELPVKPYIGHFLTTRFGNPCRLTKETAVGKFFYMLIEDGPTNNNKDYRQYSDAVKIKITEDVFMRKGYLLTPSSITTFNNFMADYIKERMFLYVDGLLASSQPPKIKQALEQSIDRFLFNENVFPYETLKKSYDRHRISSNRELINSNSRA